MKGRRKRQNGLRRNLAGPSSAPGDADVSDITYNNNLLITFEMNNTGM